MKTADFDSVAPFYDQLAALVFGKQLKKAQLYFLPLIPQGAKVLIIGGGTGWYLQEVLRSGRCQHIVYLEASAKMLQLSQQAAARVKHPCSVEFRLGTETAIEANEKFDVIVTNFLLDLFPEPQAWRLMQRLYAALNKGGLWLFTDFYIATKSRAAWWQRVLLQSMYLFFRLTSNVPARQLPDTSSMFTRLGLTCLEKKEFYKGFIKSEVWEK